MPDTVETAIYAMRADTGQYVQGMQQVAAANQKVVGSTEQVAAAEERVQAATRSTADSFSRLEARYDPLIRAEQRRQAALAQTNRFLEEGAVDQERYLAQVQRVNAFYDAQNARLPRLAANVNVAGRSYRNFGSIAQQAGFQVGDFAVQVASGQGVMRPFIQQGTQLISMFGPWGAVIGAAGAVLGALAVTFLDVESAAERAEKAAKGFEDAIDAGNRVLKTRLELQAIDRERQIKEAIDKTTESLLQQERAYAELIEEQRKAEGFTLDPESASFVSSRGAFDPDVKALRSNITEAEARLQALQQQLTDLNTPSMLFPEDPKKPKKQRTGLTPEQRLEQQFENSLLSLQDRLDPVGGAFRSLEKDLITLDLALERGKINNEGYARSVDLLYESYQDRLNPTEAALRKLTEAQADQRQELEFERQAIGIVGEEREAQIARLEAENRLRKENIPLTSDEAAQKYIDEAEALARIKAENEKIDKELKANEAVRKQSMDTLADGAGRFAEELAIGGANLKDLGDIGRTVLNDLIKLFIQLAYVNPLKNAAGVGGGLPTLSSAGFLGFGGKESSPATLGSIGRGGGGVATQPVPSGGGSDFGSFFGSIFGSILGGLSGYAHGGEFDVGGSGGTDSQLVAFRATPGERVRVETPGQQVSNDNRTSNTTIVFNLPPAPNGFGYSASQIAARSVERLVGQGRNV